MKRAKKLDAIFATGSNSKPCLSAYKSYGMNGIDSLVVGLIGVVDKGFKQLICFLAKVAAELQEAGNIASVISADQKRKGAYELFRKSFKVALGCMAIKTQAACAGNARGYHLEYSYLGGCFITNHNNMPLLL